MPLAIELVSRSHPLYEVSCQLAAMACAYFAVNAGSVPVDKNNN